MVLISAETLANSNSILTTPFKTVHKHKLHKFPFRKSFEPADGLCDIEEDEVLDNDDETKPLLKRSSSCLVGFDFVPEHEKFDLFFEKVPGKDATTAGVKAWLKLWFDATLPKSRRAVNFLASVKMDGRVFHEIRDFGWIESYLKDGNSISDGGEWLPQDIVVNLAKYVLYAKDQAQMS